MTEKTQNNLKRYRQPYYNAINFSFCLVDLKIISSFWATKNWPLWVFEYKTVEMNQRAFMSSLVALGIVSHADMYDAITEAHKTAIKQFQVAQP
jgi:hypothetical protein